MEVAKLLVEGGANVNSAKLPLTDLRTPLMILLETNPPLEAVRMFIKLGASVKVPSAN